MNKNIIPYLKYTEFEDVYKPNHFHTGHDFFIFPKNYSYYESNKKNISYFPNHISEYNQIIPEYDLNNVSYIESKRSFNNNNIFSETRELSPINNNNFLYTSKSIYLDDIHYQKYMHNLKNDNNSNSNSKAKKVINKKNNSQSKYPNSETYSIIQIYEAPPLELTPIEENEKDTSNENRKKPKYYRKKTIYSLENNFESKSKLDDKFINLNYSILDSSQDNILLKSIKSNASKTKKRIFDNKEEFSNKNDEKETHKIEKSYFKYITKDKKEKTESSLIESSNNNYKKYIKKEKENKIKLKENNYYNKYLSNISKEDKKEVLEKDDKDKYKNKDKEKNKEKEKEKEKEKDNDKEKEILSKSNYRNKIKNESMDTKQREKDIFKKIENKKYSYRSSRKYSDNKNSKQSLTIDKIEKGDKSQSNIFEEERKDKLLKKDEILNTTKINDKNGKEQKKIIKNNIEIIKSKRLSEDNKENFSKNITIISDDKIQKEDDNIHNTSNPNIERPKKYFNFEKKDEKTIVKNLLFEKNNIYKKKEEEKKIEKNYKFEKVEEQKLKDKGREIKTPQQNPNRYSFKQIRIKDNSTKDTTGAEISKTNEKEKEKTESKYKNEKKGKTNVILNIEVDKTQLSGNKRTYLYSKIERDPVPEQNSAKNNKVSENMNKNIKNNYTKKYVYSFSVEKNADNVQNERTKNYTERKKIDDSTNKQKQNDTNKTNIEKDSKKININLQAKNMNNSAISSRIELDKSENRNSNENETKKYNLVLDMDKNSDIKSNGLITPNHRSNIKNEESKNNDINSFGTTTRKFVCNYNNDNNNKDNKKTNNESINNLKNNNIKKENVNNSKVKNQSKDLKKDNINNQKNTNNNNNQTKETKNDNNLKNIINSTHKNVYRNNHNYIAIKSSGPRKINNISQYKPMKTEKTEKVTDNKKVSTDINSSSYLATEAIPSANKIEPKPSSNNNRANTRRLTNDINNVNLNNTSNPSTTTNNNSNYQVLRATSVKSVDIKTQNQNDAISKRKTIIGQINNHSMKMSYGLTTFKFPAEKKESETKIANSNTNKNNNEANLITNYINSKIALNNSGLINNNNNLENKNNVNSFINIDRSRRDAKAKNNHSLYVSISSKK